MDDEHFEELVEKAVGEIPLEFRDMMENVSVVTADWPTYYQARKIDGKHQDGHEPQVGNRGKLLLGLYEGVPRTRRGRYGIGGALPDKITIFKTPILMISRSYEDVVRQVKDTVIHEIGHHFGMSEEDIHKANNNLD